MDHRLLRTIAAAQIHGSAKFIGAAWRAIRFLALAFLLSFASVLADPLRAVLVSPDQIAVTSFGKWRSDFHVNSVAVFLAAGKGLSKTQADLIREAGLRLWYWIEIGRCPELADAHPEWQASLQGHPEWRRFFPDFPQPPAGSVVKNYPWVPIAYEEAFAAHRARVRQMLAAHPESEGVFLNDLQAAPSACGCGHPLCRWTTDYGPLRTAKSLGEDAAARFVEAIQELRPQARIVPVWAPECEEHDGGADGLCAGVNCFRGTCWKKWTEQLKPVEAIAPEIGALLLAKEFKRDTGPLGSTQNWISNAVSYFNKMPPPRGGSAISPDRLVVVLEGWDIPKTTVQEQIESAAKEGASNYVVALTRIDQSWSPRLHPIPESAPPSQP